MNRFTLRAAFFVLAAVGTLASAAGAASYYVAPTGDDRGPGTDAAPFATLQAGVDAARPGDTIIVRDGTYGPTGGAGSMGVTIAKAGMPGLPITLRAEHDGAAVLDCRLTCHSYIDLGAGASNWVIQGFDIRNGLWGGLFANSSGAKNIVVRGNAIHHIGNRSESSGTGITGLYTDAGASNWLIDGNTFHDIGRTGALDGRHDHGVYTHGSAMAITNNVFYGLKNGWHIQTAAGFSGTISGNTFYGPNPVGGAAGQVMLWGQTSSLAIRNNVFYGARPPAVTTYGLSVSGPCTIDHNLAFTPGANASVLAEPLKGCAESAETLNVDPKLGNPVALSAGSAAALTASAGPTTTPAPAPAPKPATPVAAAPVAAPAVASAAAPAPKPATATSAKPAPAPVAAPRPAVAPARPAPATLRRR